VRDFLANLVGRLRSTNRQQRLYLALGVVLLLVAGRFALTWFMDFRSEIKDDVRLTAQRLATARRLAERAPETKKQYDSVQSRYQATVAELVPGDTPTLAAAALQDRVSALASEKKVSVQTTQVLKDEPLGPFRQVSLRITASGELHDLADFLTALEFGPLRVTIPFIELSRRGAMVRKQGVGRNVSATLQVSGVVQGTAQLAAVQKAAAKGGDAAAAPAGDAPEAGADGDGAPATAPPANLGQRLPQPPGGDADREPVPADPLGTSQMVTPP
jgi:hypothetical protein